MTQQQVVSISIMFIWILIEGDKVQRVKGIEKNRKQRGKDTERETNISC